jgi:hypothetical protein
MYKISTRNSHLQNPSAISYIECIDAQDPVKSNNWRPQSSDQTRLRVLESWYMSHASLHGYLSLMPSHVYSTHAKT